jgi:hypothetical protein
MNLYHVVSREMAIGILVEGFTDQPSHWTPHRPERGVWLTERPLTVSDGLPDDWTTVLEVKFDAPDSEFLRWRWVTDGDPARGVPEERAWLIPAEIVNTRATTRLLEADLSEAEVRDALQKHEAHLRRAGRIGEQLEEAMRRFEEDLRRWEPAE